MNSGDTEGIRLWNEAVKADELCYFDRKITDDS